MTTPRNSAPATALLLAISLALALDSPVRAGVDETPRPKNEGRPVRIVLVGDSTVADGSGWGPSFARRVGPGAECVNQARSGRSSRSYRDEGHWKNALKLKPDYVLIQFGHNDQPGKGPKRETDPKTTYTEILTQYVDEARAIGAQPILVTSMTRRVYNADGRIESTLGPYADAAKHVARARSVPLVDLHARSIAFLDALGPKAAEALNPVDETTHKVDRTHLTPKGGELMADLVVAELKAVAPSLAALLGGPGKAE